MPDPVVQVTDLGVVDPMRLPPVFSRVPPAFQRLPAVAKVFAVIAVADAVDLLLRRMGSLSPDTGLVWVPGFVFSAAASVATLALPAVVWWRTPNIRRSGPHLASGAVALATAAALAILARHLNQFPIGDLSLGDPANDEFVGFAVVAAIQVARALVEARGFLWLAEGLRAHTPSNPSPTIRRLAFIAAAVMFATVLAVFVWQVLQLPDQLSNETEAFGRSTPLVVLTQPISMIAPLAFSYLVWVLIRGIGGSGRPVAVRIGVIAAMLAPVLAVLNLAVLGAGLLLRSIVNAATDFETALGWQAPLQIASIGGAWVADIARVLLVTAFALGIHERRGAEASAYTATPQA